MSTQPPEPPVSVEPLDPLSQYINTAHYVIVKRLVTEFPGPTSSEEELSKYGDLETKIMELQFAFNLAAVTPANVIDYYTRYIESDAIVEEIILAATAEFRVRHQLIAASWKSFCKTIAEGIHPGEGKHCYLHENIKSRTLPVTELTSLLECNPWFVYCIILSFANIAKVPARDVGKTTLKRRQTS